MTKGKNERRHIQNRAWEKDRRDRLNNTFDKLAKLLPEYQPKVTFSKIEILHKTIVYIEDLRKNLRDVLSAQNASILKTQEELEDSVKSLVSQNNDLVELLEKAKIKVPHFVGPKLLSFIVTVHDAKPNDENEKNQSNSVVTTIQQTSQKNGERKTKEEIQKTPQVIENLDSGSNECNTHKKPIAKVESQQQPQCQSQPMPLSNSLPELKEVQSFGSVDLIPVTISSKLDLKVHEKPVNNFVEITPLLGEKIEKSPTKPNISGDSVQPKVSTNVQDSTNDKPSTNTSIIRTQIQSSTENNRKAHKQNEKLVENIGIGKAKNKSKSLSNQITLNVQCDKKSPTKRRDSIKSNLPSAANVHTSNKPIVPDVSTEQTKRKDQTKNTNLNIVFGPNELQSKVSTENSVKVIDRNIITPNQAHSIKKVDNIQVLSKDLNESLTTGKDLSDELFGNFPLDQTPSESNPNALSPTAAFLLSFPVVSTVSSSKPIETDNSYSEGSNLLRLDEKPNQPKDHCLFESISSILNDLNDVSDSAKNITNPDNTNNGQFSYFPSNKNRLNGDQEKNNTLSDTNAHRSKHIQKNLNINNLLNDDKVKGNRCDLLKQPSVTKRPNEIQQCSTNTMPTNTFDRINYVPSKSFENVSVSTHNTSDFYVSLSTLGLPLKSAVTLPSTSVSPSVGPHFNFQISSLAQPRNLIDSRPLVADTPFTFSLTKCSDTTSTTNSTIKPISQQSEDQCQMTQHRQNKTPKKSSPTKHLVNDRFVMPSEPPLTSLNRCNSFNPFSFDNSPMLPSSSSVALGGLPTVSSVSSSIGTPFTFTLTPSFSSISNSTPLLSNHDPLFSSSFDMPIMRSSNVQTKPPKKEKPLPGYCNEKEQLGSWKNPIKTFPTNSAASKSSKNLVNWMTSSVNKPTQELQLDFIPQLTHCTANEEPPAWSPNRITMDNTNLISSSALPMLQGDLALNNISNSTSICNPPVNSNKMDSENKKTSIRTNTISPQKYSSSKLPQNRKPEHNIQTDRNGKCGKCDKNLNQPFKNQHHHHHHHHHHHNQHHQSTSNRMSESNPITNNFHSVSQLLDQERQTANKYTCYNPPIENKMVSKETSSSNATTKTKFYPKYDVDTSSNQLIENKYPLNACNSTIVNNEITTNECDRDLFGGYFFGQSKRLKLNYHHSSSELLANQSFPTAYDNSTANDMLTPYANYQSFDSDCNNVSASSCVNNLTNQTYSYQYTQPQSYVNHQTQQQTLNTCDPIDSSNYFQTPVSLSSYKPPNLMNDVGRSNPKVSTHQSFLHQTSKSTNAMTGQSGGALEPISSVKLFPCTTSTSTVTNISTQIPVGSLNRNSTTCPSKTIHYPSHNNINNLPLNQAWNDSFSWMPYTNPIEKPYNNNLFNSSDTLNSKSIATNNVGGNNNNTIPNFNLTTIFPDYNKS